MPLFSSLWSATAAAPDAKPPLPFDLKPLDTLTAPKSDAEQLEEQLRKTISVVRGIEEKETEKIEMAKRNTELGRQNRLLAEDMKELNEDIWTLEKRLTASELRNKVIDGLYMAEKVQREQDGVQHKVAVNTNRERYQQLLYEKNELADRNKELEKRCARLQRYEQMIVKCGQVAFAEIPRKRRRSAVDDESEQEDTEDNVVPTIEQPRYIADDDETESEDAMSGNDVDSVSSTVCDPTSRRKTRANSDRYFELINNTVYHKGTSTALHTQLTILVTSTSLREAFANGRGRNPSGDIVRP